MNVDDELRRALRSEAGRYDPADDGWGPITGRVVAARRRRRLQGGALGGAAVAAVALAVGLSLTAGDGTDVDVTDGPVLADEGTATTSPPATTGTTAPPTTEAPAPTGAFPGVWPFASEASLASDVAADVRFTDPVATAEAFGREYLGMLDPAVGEAEPAAAGGVEVELRPRGEDGEPLPEGGASTVVTLQPHRAADGTTVWTVTGAASPNVVVASPGAGATVGSPLQVRGRATGYEGTVVAEVREDGMVVGQALGREVGIAGSMGQLGPLSLDVAFPAPAAGAGAVVVTTDSGLDGVGVFEATVVRIRFRAGTPAAPGSCAPEAPAGAPSAGEMELTVWFVCEAAASADPSVDATYVPVVRRLPRDPAVLGAAMAALLEGTTAEEEALGLSALTSGVPVGVDVTMDGARAIVDFGEEVRLGAPGASSSTGSLLFRGAVNRTVFQFATVAEVEYRIGGSCDAFWEWQQVGACRIVARDDL